VGRGRTQSSGVVDTVIQIEVHSDKFVVGTVLLVQEWGEETQRWYWSIWIKVARTKWVDECGHPLATSVVPDPGKPVLLLRNAIDLARWTQQDVSMDPPILGWVGHTSYRSRDLEVIAPMVRQYMKAHPEVLFQHSGVDSGSYHAGQVMKLPDPPLTMPVDFESSGIAVGPLHFVQFDSRSRLVEH
jgi:hypothetical protein